MKICVITDIHSNVFALRAALAEIDRIKPDKIVCLGDIVGNGAYPEETVQLIKSRKDITCVCGNHDFIVLADLEKFSKEDVRLKGFKWQQRVLSTNSKEFLSGLKKEYRFTAEGLRVVCFHYPKKGGRFKELIYLPTEEQIKQLFNGETGDVFLFGHEHTGSFTETGNKYYLNFGTLGNLLEEGFARVGVVDITQGKVDYKLVKVPYNDKIFIKRCKEINDLLALKPD